MTDREAVEALPLTAEEEAELRDEPMLVHTYDAHRLVRLLLDPDTPSPDAGELRALSEAATPGPWYVGEPRYLYEGRPAIFGRGPDRTFPGVAPNVFRDADADFIVAAVNYVRAALTPPAAPETGETPK